jgi:hypothetical protein
MGRNEKVQIEWDNGNIDFLSHLLSETNSRIIFSGPFGAGKSTFLKQFFMSYPDHFTTMTLSPVNYSLASTEDVFELIKFDILTDLIVNHQEKLINIQSKDYFLAMRLNDAMNSEDPVGSFVNKIVSVSGDLGKPALPVLEAVDKLGVTFEIRSNEYNRKESHSFKEFIEKMRSSQASLNHQDDISTIITRCLEDVKVARSAAQNVLVIEDLDRLDPEHIFRLFNIFSLNFGQQDASNKFGFDKVIFVCDIENIQKMYQHKYGAGVDFAGYINKFYSSHPYNFDSRKYLKKHIGNLLSAIPWNMDESLKEKFAKGHFWNLLKDLIGLFVTEGTCSLRALNEAPQYQLSHDLKFSDSPGNISQYPKFFFDFYILIDFLRTLYPDLDTLEASFKRLYSKYTAEYHLVDLLSRSPELLHRYIAQICMEFLLPAEIVFNDDYYPDLEETLKKIELGDCFVHYRMEQSQTRPSYQKPKVLKITRDGLEDMRNIGTLNIHKILYETLKRCIENGYIKR